MNGWKRLVVEWIIWGVVFTFGGNYLWGGPIDRIEKDLSKKQQDLKKIKKDLYRYKKKEKETQEKESSVLKDLHVLKKDLQKKGKEIKKKEAKIRQIEESLLETNNKIITLNDTLEQAEERLILRWTALYKLNRTPSILFNPSSYPNRAKLDKYFRVTIDSDMNLIHLYRHQLTSDKKEQKKLLRTRSEWLKSFSKLEGKKEEIKRAEKKKQTLLKSVRRQKVVYKNVIGKLENKTKNLQMFIKNLERKRRLLAHKKLKSENVKGKLPWPVQGEVAAFFKKEKGQNGIEIKCPVGSKIRAVLPGKVIYAGRFKGFGNIVVIDHGNQLYTVSAYCSKLLTKTGEYVSQGRTIAQLEEKKEGGKSLFYFETRYQGRPQNPLGWISKEEKR